MKIESKHPGKLLRELISNNNYLPTPGVFSPLVAMMAEKKGEVEVVLELSESAPRNLFFRDASGTYIDYVGQFKKE